MTWDWIVKQLQGERLEIPKTRGRRVIKIGLGHYVRDQEGKPNVRLAILSVLREHGPQTTPDLFDRLAVDGFVTTPDALMHYCKRMLKRRQLSMKKLRRKDGGKGVNVWEIGESDGNEHEPGADANK